MLNPQHQIVGSVRKFPSDVITLANPVEPRTDETASSWDTGNFVAGIATIFTNLGSSQTSMSAAGEHRGSFDLSANSGDHMRTTSIGELRKVKSG